MTNTPAKVGDVYAFRYDGRDEVFNCDLVVVRVDGDSDDDFVYFDDGSHSKQKNLVQVPRVTPVRIVTVVTADDLREQLGVCVNCGYYYCECKKP